ncbi:MAG: hypothetical protein FJZ61_00160 [Chlamydiae bacterium]|nr:hypothetical protein [Chlamydiota bacterium]
MPSIQISAHKIVSCWQTVATKTGKVRGRAFSTLIRVIDVPLKNKAFCYQKGQYRWTIKIEDIHNPGYNIQEVDQVCRHQDLYKLGYEKIFYEKSLVVRRISLIRLIRKIPKILQNFPTRSFFDVPIKDVQILRLR